MLRLEDIAGQVPIPVIRHGSELDSIAGLLDDCGEEFFLAEDFSAEFIDAACQRGCLPMTLALADTPFVLGKLHSLRCVLEFSDRRIPRRLQRRAAGTVLSVDRAFDRCLEEISRRYPDNWLIPPLSDTLKELHGDHGFRTRFHSIELWDGTELIAGEIGAAVGGCYTSYSGFHRRSGAGTVQLHAAAKLLEQLGFAFWDLGMVMDYKLNLGARPLPREQFLARFMRARQRDCRLQCSGTDAAVLLQQRPHAADPAENRNKI